MKSILVLTDFSEKGLNALTYGRMLFEKMHITFYLHHIYENGAKETFLGSLAVEIIGNFRSLPIIVVPSAFHFKKPAQIVFSTNFKRAFDRKELDLLVLFGKLLRCRIRIVQIVDDKRLDDFQRVNKEYLVEILQGIDCCFEKIKVKTTETAAINTYVTKMEGDMFSMVKHRHNFLRRITRENVVKKVVFNSEVPLLIMPELVKPAAKQKWGIALSTLRF